MHTYEIIIAVALLTAPPAVDDQAPHPMEAPWAEAIRPAVLLVATQDELCTLQEDEAHSRYLYVGGVCTWPRGFSLACLQARHQNHAKAPRLAEADRFPPMALCVSALAFNRAMHGDLSRRLAMDAIHADEIREVLAELDVAHRVWESARDATTASYDTCCRREALATLRGLLGDGFYSGVMPGPVPRWRLEVRR